MDVVGDHGHKLDPNVIRERLFANFSDPRIYNISDRDVLHLRNADEEHLKFHLDHAGHESIHEIMGMLYLFNFIILQAILWKWKESSYNRSYRLVTMVVLWTVPLVISFINGFWRFIAIWFLFSACTAYVMRRAYEKPTKGTTPRFVYKWFYLVYKVSLLTSFFAYLTFMAPLVGFHTFFNIDPKHLIEVAMLLAYYGLYYGTLGQDLAINCSDIMATHLGYYTGDGMPTRFLEPDVCAVCSNKFLVAPGEEGIIENTYKLSCSHTFHEFCIRGWCIVGKKQICPYCKEKVDFKRLFPNPWEKPHVFYAELLEWTRYITAWQPVIFGLTMFINYIFGWH